MLQTHFDPYNVYKFVIYILVHPLTCLCIFIMFVSCVFLYAASCFLFFYQFKVILISKSLLPSSFLKLLRNILTLMNHFINSFYLTKVQLHLFEIIGTAKLPDMQKIRIFGFLFEEIGCTDSLKWGEKIYKRLF